MKQVAKLLFNKQNRIETPTLILENKNFEKIGVITNASDLSCRIDFNGADEFSFTVQKESDGQTCPLWDEITDFKVLYIPELKERFEITVSLAQEIMPYKTVTATGLCEAELSQLTVRSLEVNTESDISMPDYAPTVFYNEKDPEHSLLHRVLNDKAPHYKIVHVDDSLAHMQRTFSFSGSDIYSILTGEIAEEFDCVFFFDSLERSIHAYDLLNSCQNPNCDYLKTNHARYPYRGDFDTCPYCSESKYVRKGYGKDTSVFISNENLASQIALETNADSVKNCFYVEGGDEAINAALAMINPNGTSYIYSFYENTLKDMPEELVAKMKRYDEEYQDYNTSHSFEIEDKTALDDYNGLISRINTLFQYQEFDEDGNKNRDWFEPLPKNGVLTSYPSVIRAIYNAIDLYGFVKDAMLPTVDIDGMGIDDSVTAIENGFAKGFPSDDGKTYFQNTIAVADTQNLYSSSAERAVEKTAKLFFSTAYYSVKTVTESYPDSHTSWTGHFILTSRTKKDVDGNFEKRQSKSITLNIISSTEKGVTPDPYALYIQLAIRQKISDSDSLKSKQITGFDLTETNFKEQLQYYSCSELENLLSEFQSCIDVVTNLPDNSSLDNLHQKYYDFYFNRYKRIDDELRKRKEDLAVIEKMYVCNFNTEDTAASENFPESIGLPDAQNSPSSTVRGYLYDFQDSTTTRLNFRNYIGEEMYHLFCSYRREDSYSNSNYISDGLSNAEIIQRAQELLETANRELYTASHPQYSITASMDNLLELPEFEPLKNDFETGNFIRMEIDGNIYRLRLLSYSIHFDELQNIDVEFSTVKATVNGTNDIESVLSAASSMAGSYDSVKKQMAAADKSAKYIDNWIQYGLNATNVTYTNSDSQEALIDKHGILLREYDPISQKYSRYQAKFLSNGMYITNDDWKTIHTGLGRFTYYDPESQENVEEYGLIANTIAGKLIIGENLKIYNENSSVIIDKDGITLDGGHITWKNPIERDAVEGLVSFQKNLGGCLGLGANPTTITADSVISPKIGGGYAHWTNGQYSIVIDPNQQAGTGTQKSYLFRIEEDNSHNILMGVDATGNTYFKGEIETLGGEIGGFTIGSNAIYKGTNSMTSTAAGVYLGTDGIRQYKSGSAYVNIQNGVLTAQGAVIKQGTLNFLDITGADCGTIRVATNKEFSRQGIYISGQCVGVSGSNALKLYGGVAVYIESSSIDMKAVDINMSGTLSVSGDASMNHCYIKSVANGGNVNHGNSLYHPIVTIPLENPRAVSYINSNSDGTIQVGGQFGASSWSSVKIGSSSSDIRLKENISDTTECALDTLMKIKMRQFDWIRSGSHQKIGFIADELEEIDIHFAFGGGYEEDGSMNVKSVDTFYMMGYVVKAIQELASWKSQKERHDANQQTEIAALKAENAQLKSQIAFLTEQMETILRKQ